MAKTFILVDLMSELGFKPAAFERETGISNGLINKNIRENRDISADMIEKIVRRYPLVNKKWLETGQGDVFLSNDPVKNTPTGNGVNNSSNSLISQSTNNQFDMERLQLYEMLKESIDTAARLSRTIENMWETGHFKKRSSDVGDTLPKAVGSRA